MASALFAYASANRVSGRQFVEAFVFGFEAESRVANAVYPAHYDAGWHITGTSGVFGAATAIGKLLGLDHQQMVWAIGLAATQAAGLREMFGSMAKSFHPGRSAQNGYAAALLAQAGFTAGERGIEGARGFAAVTASRFDLSKVTDRLGVDFDLRANTYKPFPCGIVNHPTIDACIQLHEAHRIPAAEIASVQLRVAPLVLDLCNQTGITKGLQGKFSVYHGAAVGLVRGKAGIQEYTDAAVNDPAVKRVRELTTGRGRQRDHRRSGPRRPWRPWTAGAWRCSCESRSATSAGRSATRSSRTSSATRPCQPAAGCCGRPDRAVLADRSDGRRRAHWSRRPARSRCAEPRKWRVVQVLVAEDDRDIGELIARYVQRNGWTVRLVTSGTEALSYGRSTRSIC